MLARIRLLCFSTEKFSRNQMKISLKKYTVSKKWAITKTIINRSLSSKFDSNRDSSILVISEAIRSGVTWYTSLIKIINSCIRASMCYILICIYTCIYMQNNSQRHNDKGWVKTSLTKYVPLTLFVTLEKGYSGFACERELETEQKLQYFDTHSYGRQRCVFLVLQGCSTGGPEAQLSARWWLSLLHLIGNFSGPQLNRGPRAPSAWCGFPHHISSITPSDLQLSDFCLDWVI